MNEMHTYMGLVRNPADATLIFEACRQGKLPRIQRRLSDRERNAIRSGSIFVWDEKEAGMRRWTDGKSWSASRVAGSFLTYREMEGKRAVTDLPHQSGRGPGHSGDDSDDNHDPHDNQKYEMTESYKYKVDGLIKQSFSITTSEDQKLHLISYYGRTFPNNVHLRPPTQDPALMHIQIPRGLYPESTLEMTPSPGGLVRPEDARFPPVHNAAPIAPAPASANQQASVNNFPPSHPMASNYQDPSWDYRGVSNPRPPREIRPALYDGREHANDHHPGGPRSYGQPQSHPQQHAQQPQSHHHPLQHSSHQPHHHTAQHHAQHTSNLPPQSQQHHRHSLSQNGHAHPQSHSSAQSFHPSYPYQSPLSDKTQGQSNSGPLYRSGPPPPPPLSSSQVLGLQNVMHQSVQEHRPPPPPPPYVPNQELHSTSMHNHDRRQSLPRMNEAMRRTSSVPFPVAPRGAANETPSRERATSAVAQQPNLSDIPAIDWADYPNVAPACDIPPEKLGRWAEETRVLDQLSMTLKL